MKKYLLALAVALSLFSFACFADGIRVTLNGNEINCLEYGQEPVIENGRTLVPLRSIFEALGAEVEWNNEEKSVLSTKDDVTIYLKINDNRLIKNGKEIILDVPAKIEHGRTLVPVRAVAEAFDVEVGWDKETMTVELFDIRNATFSKGEISDDKYKNQYLGIDFILPDGCAFWSDVQIKSALGYVKEENQELDIEVMLGKYEFVASDKNGNNIQLTAEQKSDIAYFVPTEGGDYKMIIGGIKYSCFDVKNDDLTQTYATNDRGEMTVSMVFTYHTIADFEKLLSGFEG